MRSARFDGGRLALPPFLEGERLSVFEAARRECWTSTRTLASIHGSTSLVADVIPRREGFGAPWEEAPGSARPSGCIPADARPGLRALRQLVLPRREDVLEQFGGMHALREAVVRLDSPCTSPRAALTR